MWHGYSDAQVRTIWYQHGWQNRTVTALKTIIECEDAVADVRLGALRQLNYFTIATVLPSDPCMPSYICKAMLAIAECKKEKRRERTGKLMEERLQACTAILETMSQFVPQAQAMIDGDGQAQSVSKESN